MAAGMTAEEVAVFERRKNVFGAMASSDGPAAHKSDATARDSSSALENSLVPHAPVTDDADSVEDIQDPAQNFRKDPRLMAIEVMAERLSKKLLIWEVVGGNKGGIMVRETASLKSPELKGRLANGSLIRELDSKGDRICYQLLEGQGPRAGWVSSRAQGTELLGSVSRRPELIQRASMLTRRLAMMPTPFRDLLSISLEGCQSLTEDMHSKNGCLAELSKSQSLLYLWHATQGIEKDFDANYAAFPNGDPLISRLLADSSLKPVRRAIPRHGSEEGQPEFHPVIDAASGLLPDTMATVYFLGGEVEVLGSHTFVNIKKQSAQGPRLQGAVRFGAQAVQSMCHVVKEDAGEFFPGVHGGAEACLLYDAGLWLGRLAWQPNATLKKISCQFTKPCPALKTIEILATLGQEDFDLGTRCRHVTVKVSMRIGKLLIAMADVQLVSFPLVPRGMPEGLPNRCNLACPSIDWVPEELSKARLPKPSAAPPDQWDTKGYLAAAFNVKEAVKFPRSCAAVEDVTKGAELAAKGILRVERANRPFGPGDYRNDLCFPGGLAPAAISHVHYFDDSDSWGNRFEGTVKFGPQATEACFLEKGGKRLVSEGCMSLAAHFGMPLAALDDFLAHLARFDGKEKNSVTWKLDMEVHSLVPIGHELQFRCICPRQQTTNVGTLVKGDISFEDKILVTASVIATS
eukprot:TRINITY_DN18293_c0_g1_i1.p1 TRINITY_DN18293_c0_g1~~TRINITY_DN18293_c0_g1_i1.p1  ORF type:complete len:710 (+),score=119.81 TRINITY_DN18293_c0_g1_i1:65-2131(+)